MYWDLRKLMGVVESMVVGLRDYLILVAGGRG